MRRYLYLLSPLLALLFVSYALAQEAAGILDTTPSTSTGNYIWKLFLTALTLGGSALTPYATKYATMGVLIVIGKAKVSVPEPILIFISTVIAGVVAGVMGANTDMVMHADTATLTASTIALVSQKLANSAPVTPSPEAMAKVMHKEPTAIV